MDVAFFITVGTGKKTEVSIKSLAHGILSAIIHYNPDVIVFFGSDESRRTIDSLKDQYSIEQKKELITHEFITLNDVDDFDECFSQIRKKIGEYEDYEIVIDYTSGTKTMTMSVAICSMLYHKRLNLISGKRGKEGIVISGTEKSIEQNLYSAYDKLLFDRVKDMFNLYRFEEAKTILNQIVVLEEKEKYKNIIDAYNHWDKFDHQMAFLILKDIDDVRISQNKAFLGELLNRKDNLQYYIIDLINNAARRIEEKKYDDAVARLYRTIELIAQTRLFEKGLIDKKRLKENMLFAVQLDMLEEVLNDETMNKYCNGQKEKDLKHKILKLGLHKSYELLSDLNDEVGTKFCKDNTIKDILQSRNSSILAHGLQSVEKDVANNLYEIVNEYARIISPKELEYRATFLTL